MTRTPRLFSLAAVAVLAVAACGGSVSSASPSTAPVVSEGPASLAPPSDVPSVAPATAAPAAEGPDVGAAAAALDDVQRYALDLQVSGLMEAAEGASGIAMNGVVDREKDAYQFDLSGVAGLEALGGSEIGFILIGPDAWISTGGSGYIRSPGGSAMFSQFTQGLAPAALLGMVPPAAVDAMSVVGQEDKNGVATTHYRVTGADSAGVAEGLGQDAVMDVWIAEDGGYMVSLVMDGVMDVQGTDTPISMSMDISRINDESIEIEAPN